MNLREKLQQRKTQAQAQRGRWTYQGAEFEVLRCSLPALMALGVLPKPFFDVAGALQAEGLDVTDASNKDEFETALAGQMSPAELATMAMAHRELVASHLFDPATHEPVFSVSVPPPDGLLSVFDEEICPQAMVDAFITFQANGAQTAPVEMRNGGSLLDVVEFYLPTEIDPCNPDATRPISATDARILTGPERAVGRFATECVTWRGWRRVSCRTNIYRTRDILNNRWRSLWAVVKVAVARNVNNLLSGRKE